MERIGGWRTLVSVWVLTLVPAAFGLYILRSVLAERWPQWQPALESPLGALLAWVLLAALLAVWGLGGVRRRNRPSEYELEK
jgi:hypothetical protein